VPSPVKDERKEGDKGIKGWVSAGGGSVLRCSCRNMGAGIDDMVRDVEMSHQVLQTLTQTPRRGNLMYDGLCKAWCIGSTTGGCVGTWDHL
jgi:hypothetical protein